MPTDDEIPEEAQAAALRRVRNAANRRNGLLRQADEILNDEIRPAAVEATRQGAGRTRVREEAGVGVAVYYRWLEQAGLPTRPKSPPRGQS